MGSRWLSARAVRLHLTVFVVVVGCLSLGWWQLERALSGNTLSWVYTFEWPFFAPTPCSCGGGSCTRIPMSGAIAGSRGSRTRTRTPSGPSERDAQDEIRLAEYNRYLADLQEIDRSRRN